MTKADFKSYLFGLLFLGGPIFLVIFLLWFTSYDRLSPEEKARIQAENQEYYNKLHYCEGVLDNPVIDTNNTQFQECYKLFQRLEEDSRNSR